MSPTDPTPRLESPISFTTAPALKPRKKKDSYKVTKPAPRTPMRKRRRALSDDLGPSNDQENGSHNKPSTPKRQRKYPPTLPLGLDQRDFDDLLSHSTPETAAHTPFQMYPDTTFTTPSRPLPFNLPFHPGAPSSLDPSIFPNENQEDTPMPTPEDDAALTTLILSKLRLRQEDWDECARKLSERGGKDSIGERWKMLVAREDAGVQFARRRSGLRRRGSLANLLEMEM
ncbi:uncharacterized protein KY384_003845 [Bacidia gigantensis]|uniref:uncharacterized protein n=1 Tax=Bacidia gigantensis TaxID=2732470 RepID=UPI001D03C28F|nr:uncharacterized protein KY384_003845 [Bacidia gigantensis]KAG8532204.1 hypothetical protein KY384_003845 [Bacidia gigantensis]